MNIRKLSIQEAKEVYNTFLVNDFPRDERKPFPTIEKSMRKGQYICFAADDSDGSSPEVANISGYAFFVVNGNNYLFDYFAIRRDLRDKGCGSAFLRRLAGEEELRRASCVLLEIENPRLAAKADKEVCKRREQFYLRNGLADTGVESETFGVEYRIFEMPLNGAHSQEEVRRIYGELYRSYLPGFIYRTMVRIAGESD